MLWFYFLWRPHVCFSLWMWFSPLSIQIGMGVWGDGSGQICLLFPQMTEDSLSLYVSRTKHENSRGYSIDTCPEIQERAEYYHYLNHTVLEIIIFWKSNLLKIIFMPFMLMVDDYPMMSSLSYHSVGMLISSEERCDPHGQVASSELRCLIWGVIFLPFW